jgi:sugar lactone lactonase YvrE
MRTPIRVLPLALAALLAPAPAAAAAAPHAHHHARHHAHLPAVVRTAPTALFPEGVAWDPTRHAFLVGSARNGTVSVVRPGGEIRPLVDDPGVVSTFGLAVDARRGRVLVTYADIGTGERSSPETQQHQSGLLVADLATGRVLRRIDLALGDGPHAANDVTVDPRGTAWVTDTAGDAVFRVDPGRGAVLGAVRDPRFASEALRVKGIV